MYLTTTDVFCLFSLPQELVVNTVAISSSHEYVTGGTDNNLVCIWKTQKTNDDDDTHSSQDGD